MHKCYILIAVHMFFNNDVVKLEMKTTLIAMTFDIIANSLIEKLFEMVTFCGILSPCAKSLYIYK